MKFYLSLTTRNDLGQVRSLKADAMPDRAAKIIKNANRRLAREVVYDQPPNPFAKRPRGRPVGYRCSEDTKRKMVEHRGRVYRGGDELHA